MQERLEQVVKGVSNITYSISGGLVISNWLSFIDHYAAAIGTILGVMTFITNFIFQVLNHRAIKAKSNQ